MADDDEGREIDPDDREDVLWVVQNVVAAMVDALPGWEGAVLLRQGTTGRYLLVSSADGLEALTALDRLVKQAMADAVAKRAASEALAAPPGGRPH